MNLQNTICFLLGTILIFFMQAGFMLLETGFTRVKNAGNIVMRNLINLCFSSVLFWIGGFGLMFGSGNAIIGKIGGIATETTYGTEMLPKGIDFNMFFVFQTMLCVTSVAIIFGAIAERTKFLACSIISIIFSLVVYPVSGHWTFGGGWLSKMGFHDFAGGAQIHLVAGIAGLMGAIFLGARIGKYGKDGRTRFIPGHSLTLAALGVFILWIGGFGLNCSSLISNGEKTITEIGDVLVSSNIATVIATITVMVITWVRYEKPDIYMSLNGALGGMVAITAGCDTISVSSSAIIGIIAGIVVVFGIEFVDQKLKVDDPLGVVSVHGLCGALGAVCVGLFSNGSATVKKGLFYGGGIELLGIELLGVVSIALWVAIIMGVAFLVIKNTLGLRVSEQEEIMGLDYSEHGLNSAYADFPAMINSSMAIEKGESYFDIPTNKVPLEEAVPVKEIHRNKEQHGPKMTKIDIICKQEKFEIMKAVLNEIGVTGITVTQVLGCGMQKGNTKVYRGIEVDVVLLPKVKIEVVVSKVPVRTVVEAARKALYTGNIGDGKIFVYDVENVIKVRTGEEGYEALQGEN